jgi:hypothetical protein
MSTTISRGLLASSVAFRYLLSAVTPAQPVSQLRSLNRSPDRPDYFPLGKLVLPLRLIGAFRAVAHKSG